MLNQVHEKFDVVIAGGGIAGLSTALWCDELKLSALLLEGSDALGGQLLRVFNEIKNYPGREARNGRELCDAFLAQIGKRNFELRLRSPVGRLDAAAKTVVLADGTGFAGRAVVIATGVRRRRLGVPGENEFRGRGILESGQNEAASVAGRNVVVAGGGDAAFENALILAATAARVTLVHRRREFRARPEFVDAVRAHPKIEILAETVVRRFSGSGRLESVELYDSRAGEISVRPVEAALIRIGVAPNTEILRGVVALDEAGYVAVDRDCATSVAGIFAVGDVANPHAPTVSGAVGMGATAAKVIFALLNP
ncbi:MAG: FAD-dependent oxidoreductase [Acidobacteria bacterium]|nr:FAD-dependent oxidoreductase [Acidobacteriota bacterium]